MGRYDIITKMLSSQRNNTNQHSLYIIAIWYLLGIITRQGFLFHALAWIGVLVLIDFIFGIYIHWGKTLDAFENEHRSSLNMHILIYWPDYWFSHLGQFWGHFTSQSIQIWYSCSYILAIMLRSFVKRHEGCGIKKALLMNAMNKKIIFWIHFMFGKNIHRGKTLEAFENQLRSTSNNCIYTRLLFFAFW